MRFKKVIVLPTAFFLSALIAFLIMSTFQLYPNTLKLKKTLKGNEYELLDGVKIYNLVNAKRNTEIIDEIDHLNGELAILLGSIKKIDLTILLFEEPEEIGELGQPQNVVAFYDKKLKVVVLAKPKDENKLFLTEELRHEYTHYYLNTYLKENEINSLPSWFEEGLAEYVGITLNGGKAMRPIGEINNFMLLKSHIAWNIYSQNSNYLYTQAHHALEYIVRNNDQDIIKKVIDDSAQLDFSKSFYKHTGIEIKELHKLIN